MKRQALAALAALALVAIPVAGKLLNSAPALAIETDKVAYRDVRSSVLASGHLLYEDQVVLSPEVIGKVATIFVKEGARVTKGDLVMHLDDQSYRAEVGQQQAGVRQQQIAIEQQQLNLANQERQFTRKQELYASHMVAEAQIDDARYAVDSAKIELRNSGSRLDQAEAILRQSNERLAKTDIRAPISGTVTVVSIRVGETAIASQIGIAGSSLMTIANTDSMVAELNVDEADIAKVALGQDVAIHTAAFPDATIQGQVLSISQSRGQDERDQALSGAPSLARTYTIKVRFAQMQKQALRPGMSCRAEIFMKRSGKALALPVQAVISNNDESIELAAGKAAEGAPKSESHVFVYKDGRAESRVVTLGESDDTYQEIASGLSAGDAVVTGPYKVLRHLRDGDRVSLKQAARPASAAAAAKP